MITHIFPLMGQSNMVGAGQPEEREVNDRIWFFNHENNWQIVEDNLYSPNSIYDSIPNSQAYSLGIEFADQMIGVYPEDDLILLVPCARGGSHIEEQIYDNVVDDMGIVHPKSLGNLCIERVNAALASCECAQVEAILYLQGESDYKRPDVWVDEMPNLINKMKTAFNISDFIIGQVGDYYTDNLYEAIYWLLLKRHQMNFALLNNIPMVITEDLPQGDCLHFNTEGLKIIGRRYAEMYKAIHGIQLDIT